VVWARCVAFLGAELKAGSELVLDAVGFDASLRRAALVVTGEGRLDKTSLMGKLPGAVATRARRARVPCVTVGGDVDRRALRVLGRKLGRIESLTELAGSCKSARDRAAYWLERLARERAGSWL